MNSIFISYSGSRLNRSALFYALRDYGLNPWRDVESLDLGDATTGTIEAELEGCSAVILWINEDVLASEYVATVELPTIAKVWRRTGMRIVPVFDGLSPREGTERLSRFGIEVGENNGYVVDPGKDDETTAAEIAGRCVRARVADARKSDALPIVRLVSYDDTAELRADAVVNFDWRHHLTEGSLEPLNESRLRTALAVTAGAIKGSYGPAEITLAVKSHLPLAVAVGHAFAEPTGCTLRMHRDAEMWPTSRNVVSVDPLEREEGMKGPVDSRAGSVEVSVTRDVESGVNAHVGGGTRYRHRVMLKPASGPRRDAVVGSGTANAWAKQIGDALTALADAGDVDRVDLFLATPVELAVAVGWWANAAGPVDVMQWLGKTGPYERMWTLP